MTLLGNSFVTDDEEDAGYKLVPDNTVCTLIIKQSDVKTTNAGDGQYIKITAEVLDEGEFSGTPIWHNFNTVNPNDTAVKIGRGQLKRLCQILGISELTDTAELHGQPFKGLIAIKKGTGGYDDANIIKKFLPLNDDDDEDSNNGSTSPFDED